MSAITARMKRLALVVVAAVALVACAKSEKQATSAKKADPAPVTAGKVEADGTRKVTVEVKKDGYHPDSLRAKPNEKLVLVFTRVEDTECGAEVKVADGKVHALPMNQPVEIPVTVPASGKIAFACGMDMMSGVIVVDG